MFSSSKNSHFPPPSFDTSTSFHCLNSSETLLRHHHDMFSGHYNLVDNSPVLQGAIDDLTVPSDTALGYNQDVDMLGTTVNAFPRRKRTVKNDRHSKIFTATGPRDRRVRLSISIARKFFDLQDMLDFDKPSKTLDWLLTKSKTAINELIRTKRSTDNVHSTPSECGNNKAEENCWESLGTDLKNKSLINATNSEEVKDPQQASALLTARDSRAKARARARERTREKKCSKGLSVQTKQVSDFSNSIPSQSRPSNSVLGTFQQNHIASSDLNPYCSASSPNYDADQDWDIILNPYCSASSPNYDADQDWDISSIIRQSSS